MALAEVSLDTLIRAWPWIAGVLATLVVVVATAHVVLHKRDVRAAIAWTGLIVLSPFFGAAAYWLLGINRIHRRASKLVAEREAGGIGQSDNPTIDEHEVELSGRVERRLAVLARLVGRTAGTRLVDGNAVMPLFDGDAAYPAMLEAISAAEHSVLLSTYIFDSGEVGDMFVDALAQAHERGVEVRVLVDSVGARYSRPPITRLLRRRGVPCARFLPTRLPWRSPYMNLRNHRKTLIVDRRVAFSGGMNIRDDCLLAHSPSFPTRDVQFKIEGPIVDDIFEVSADDWRFETAEELEGPAWASGTAPAGESPMRVIVDGPDDNVDTMRWVMIAALGAARERVRIVTPYFLPDQSLVTALRLAVARDVRVDLVLPEKNNLRFVQWASTAFIREVVEAGVRVWLVTPPFDHSKMFIVDHGWSLIGSANWDERSLRLNFELALECYDETLAGTLCAAADERIRSARELAIDEIDRRSLTARLRDGVARLASPYL